MNHAIKIVPVPHFDVTMDLKLVTLLAKCADRHYDGFVKEMVDVAGNVNMARRVLQRNGLLTIYAHNLEFSDEPQVERRLTFGQCDTLLKCAEMARHIIMTEDDRKIVYAFTQALTAAMMESQR